MKPVLVFLLPLLLYSEVLAQSLKTDYAFRKYLLENVRYPEAAIQQGVSDRAHAFFEVGADGKVTKVEAACGHRELGFDQSIKQALLAAPIQAKSATGKYLVRFEFNLRVAAGQNRNNEVVSIDTLAIPEEGMVQLNTIKIEATATTQDIGKKQQSVEVEKATNRSLPPTSAPNTNALTYTMRKAEREHPIKSKKTGKELGAITVSYEYPVFNDERLNAILRKKFIKQTSFEAAADAYITEGKKYYADYNEEYIPASGLGQSYDFTLKVIRQTARFLFLQSYHSSNSAGAAHNSYGEIYPVYDINNLQMLQLDDILTGGGRHELRQIVERVFRQTEKLSPTASLCDNYLFDKCRFDLAENFTVTENALEFIYNPYEGKSFAAGVWSIKISYSLIKHLIKPEYTALFGQTVKEVAAPPKATVVTPRTNNTLSYLKEYQGQYPSQVGLFENEELPRRMKNLMSTASFAKFIGYAQKEKPIQFYNGLALVTGCKQNDCERYESVVFINTGLDKVYIGLLDNDQLQTWSDHPAFKSYDPTSMPADFKAWFLDASGKARGRRGNEPKTIGENEKVSDIRSSSNLLGANSPEELGTILLRALQNNDKTTWVRCIHPEQVENREIIIKRFAEVRDHLYQQGLTNWSAVKFSRVTFERNDHKSAVKGTKVAGGFTIEFTYKNDEFVGEIYFWSAATVAYENTYFIWGYPDLSYTSLQGFLIKMGK